MLVVFLECISILFLKLYNHLLNFLLNLKCIYFFNFYLIIFLILLFKILKYYFMHKKELYLNNMNNYFFFLFCRKRTSCFNPRIIILKYLKLLL